MEITIKTKEAATKGQRRKQWVEETLDRLGPWWKEEDTHYRDGGAKVRLVCATMTVEAAWETESPQQVADGVNDKRSAIVNDKLETMFPGG